VALRWVFNLHKAENDLSEQVSVAAITNSSFMVTKLDELLRWRQV